MVGRTGAQYQQCKLRAADIFVDREEPKSLFVRTAQEFAAASPRNFRFLGFYGAGGQGKTSLCTALIALMREEPLKSLGFATAVIDLHANRPGDYLHALVALRNAIAAATQAQFGCFDLALTDYYDQLGVARPHMRIGGPRLHGFAADLKEGFGETLVEGVKAGVGELFKEAVGGVPFVGPSLKRMAKWAFAEGAEAYLRSRSPVLEGLYKDGGSPPPKLIRTHLPDILAHEFALWARSHPKRPLAMFIDEYENVLPAGGSKAHVYASSEWDEALRHFISACSAGGYVGGAGGKGAYSYDAGFLLMIFGREKLRWDRLDSGWAAEMEHQHALGGLAETDALGFLEEAGIAEPALRLAIVAASTAPDPRSGATTAYPMMLDLGIQIYFDVLAAGRTPTAEDFEIRGASYVERRRSLLQRFLRNLSDHEGMEALLRRLACVREFDRELAVQLADRFARGFDRSYFDDLTALTFVGPAGDGVNFVMHNHIRDALLDSLPPVDARETHAWLADWFIRRATPASPKAINLDHAEAMGDAIVHQAHAGLPVAPLREGPRERLLDWPPARSRMQEAVERAVEIRRRQGAEGELQLADQLRMLSVLYHYANKVSDAADLIQQAADIRRKLLPDDHLDIASSLRDLGVAAYAQRRWNDAKRHFARAYEIRCEKLPADDARILVSLHDLALTHAVVGEKEEAASLFAKALEMSHRMPLDDAENVGHLLYNVACYRVESNALDEALPMAQESLRVRLQALPDDHPSLTDTRLLVADIQVKLGAFDDAFSQAEAAMEQMLRANSRSKPAVARTARLLIDSARGLRREAGTTTVRHSACPPPLYAGEWRTDEALDRTVTAALDTYCTVATESGVVPFSQRYDTVALRYLALPFWGSDCWLCEAQAPPALFYGLLEKGRLIVDTGASGPIHERNILGIDLSTPELRLAYLTFFCSWIRGNESRFALIRCRDDLRPFARDSAALEALYAHVAAPTDQGFAEGGDECRMSANIVYDGNLFRSSLVVKRSGVVEMLNDEPVDTGAIKPAVEIWTEPFRLSGVPAGRDAGRRGGQA